MVAVTIPSLNAYAVCDAARSIAHKRVDDKIRLCWGVRSDTATRMVLRTLLAKGRVLRSM